MKDKSRLRKTVLSRVGRMTKQEKEMASMLASQNAMLTTEVKNANAVMLFASMEDEPDIWALVDTLLERGKIVMLPVIHNGSIVPVEYCPDDILLSNRYGTLEPDIRYEQPVDIIDVVIIPGVAFDERGHRLGRGGSYYDRFLSSLSCIRIGLCFEVQIELRVPFEPHDAVMDAVCTDKRLIVCNDRVTPLHVNVIQ